MAYDEAGEEEEIAAALRSIARALHQLGLGNASTQMGAIEALAKEVKEGSERIESGLTDIADAIRNRDA